MYNREQRILNNKEEVQEKLLRRLFNPDDKIIIFDIGACEGINSLRYSRMFPNSRIYSFEPLDDNIKIFNENITTYNVNNIELYNICLSNQTGNAAFYVSEGTPERYKDLKLNWDFGNKSSSLLPPHKTKEFFPWLKFNKRINVKTDTLNNFCNKKGIGRIDFIHLDVQGAELKVLEGADQAINKIKYIWLEVEAISLYKDQPLKKDIEKFFFEHGFAKIMDTVGGISGDQFYVNTSFLQESAPPQVK